MKCQILLAATVLAVMVAAGGAAEPARIAAVAHDTPIMPLADVRIGMRGYGLTVFHGTAIEPFPVEVVSIVSDESPRRGVIWVRCTDERMRLSGPVQGMSGSPIYLWNPGEAETIGEGGRLIGAFAFGYPMSKDCYVGVQPIELMRDIASRKDQPAAQARGSWTSSRRAMAQLADIAEQRGQTAWRAELLRRIVADKAPIPAPGRAIRAASPDGPRPLLLPLGLGSGELASAVRPLFEPLGLSPVAGDTLAGPPPAGIDAPSVRLAPGSVLAVPLAFGDLDLAAAGTVTDVLADGTVLGFGHPMFGEGAAALPMATGYVHFVQPSLDISFKRTGTLHRAGSLVRDEESGVLGVGDERYTTAPMDVTVIQPDGSSESFHYEAVNYKPLTPQIAAVIVIRSLIARHGLPPYCTLDLDADVTFAGQAPFHLSTTLAGADFFSPAFELLPLLAVLSDNPFQPLAMQSMQVTIRVREGVEAAMIVRAGLDRAEVQPGDRVRVTLELQPHTADPVTLTGTIDVPHDMPEGDYPLLIGGGPAYAAMLSQTNPHHARITSLDDLAAMLRRTYAVPAAGVYLMLERPDGGGLAADGAEMPHLPSSRAAMLTSPTRGDAVPFGRLISTKIDTPLTLSDQTLFQISVRDRSPVVLDADED